jgi:hypothetical protein
MLRLAKKPNRVTIDIGFGSGFFFVMDTYFPRLNTPVQTGTGLQTDTLVHAGTEITVRSVTHNDKNQETNRGIFCPENPKERRFHGTYLSHEFGILPADSPR